MSEFKVGDEVIVTKDCYSLSANFYKGEIGKIVRRRDTHLTVIFSVGEKAHMGYGWYIEAKHLALVGNPEVFRDPDDETFDISNKVDMFA